MKTQSCPSCGIQVEIPASVKANESVPCPVCYNSIQVSSN